MNKRSRAGKYRNQGIQTATAVNIPPNILTCPRHICSMKKLFSTLFARNPTADPSMHGMAPHDPDAILFSVPTLSKDLAPLDPVPSGYGVDSFIFHEDEWSQVEFLPATQLRRIQDIMSEYSVFEESNRLEAGWKKVYVRDFRRVPVISGDMALPWLQRQLAVAAHPAPLLFSTNRLLGSVRNGFSLPLGANVTLYGYHDEDGIPALGAYLGPGADNTRLLRAFSVLNAAIGLILVDWRSRFILVSSQPSGQVEAWHP